MILRNLTNRIHRFISKMRLLDCLSSRVLGFLLVIVMSTGLYSQDQEAKPKAETPKIEAIPVSKISAESEKVLSTISSQYQPAVRDSVIQQVKPQIDSLHTRMEGVISLTQYVIDQNFNADINESFITKWDQLISNIKEELDRITDYTDNLDDVRKEMIETRKLWNFTSEQFESEEFAADEAKSRIQLIINELSTLENELNDSLNKALDQQNQLVDLKLAAESEMESQRSILQKELSALIAERSEYIWNMSRDSLSGTRNEASNEFYYSYNKQEAKRYLDENVQLFYWLAAILIGFLLLLYGMMARLKEVDQLEESIADIGRGIFKRPIFTALFLASISAIPFLMDSPIFIAMPLVFVIVLSFVFVVPVTIVKYFRLPVYGFVIIYFYFLSQDLILLDDFDHRIYNLFLNIALILFLGWFRVKQRHSEAFISVNSIWFGLLKTITPVFLLILVIGLFANFLGYLYLSYLINGAVVRSFFIAMVFGLVYTTFTAVFTLFMYTPVAEKLNLLFMYRDLIIKRAKALFQILYIFFWARFTLASLHLYLPTLDLLNELLEVGVMLQDFEITIGSFLHFLLIIFAAWLISNLVRLLLQDEILARFNMAKGVPMAIASITYYTMIVIGVIMALIALGFDITHLSVLAGALGIGIGFGLQNVVNNFISGLILIFERPITVGDIVNLQTIEGQVISIGIRSSKVQQYDGSVLIVPNADLISNQVVNFTLTDDKRRFILPIYTDTDVDPAKVLEIMTEAATSVPEVISNPPAKSYFTGTEDQSRVFKLYFWVSGLIFLKAKSDVTVLVHQKLEENGIVVKAQREVKLRKEE